MAKILVVDDQKLIRNMFKAILDSTGHAVDFAEDGKEAYIEATKKNYSLVLADLVMPIMDGIEFITKLRALSNYKDTPMYIISSISKDDKKAEARQAGANGWFLKPISEESVWL